jgi:Fur family ferric uptake transcriptional regulator
MSISPYVVKRRAALEKSPMARTNERVEAVSSAEHTQTDLNASSEMERRSPPGRGTTSRSTRQGHAVSTALAATDAFTSAQDLHARLREQGHSVGLTTVYRHLQVLADRGEVDVLRRDDGETVYRRCASGSHHHHLVCRRCGHTVEVKGPEIEAWTERVATASGFSDVAHTVEIYGLCAACTSGATDVTAAPG